MNAIIIGKAITIHRSPESPGKYIATKTITVVINGPQSRYFLFGIAPIAIPKMIGNKTKSIQL